MPSGSPPSGGVSPILKALPVRIVIPVALTLLLFILTLFLVILPRMEEQMMAGKRQTVMHLTEAAWSTLNHYQGRAAAGEITPDQARAGAVAQLKALRLGAELQDYVWINDMTPVMVMHPFRPDLVGRDVGDFRDSAGTPIFRRMVETVEKQGAGFVDYLWEHPGDPRRSVAKVSYIKGFQPWGWMVGTGLYVADVRAEIRAVTRTLVGACSGIMVLVFLLSAYIVREAMREKKDRLEALERSRLRETQLIQADKMASLGVLVAGVAHEVNNPATTLMLNAPSLKRAWEEVIPVLDHHFQGDGNARVCNMAWPDLRDRMDPMLDGILDSSARIKQIISELKDFSRPSAEDMDEWVDPARVVAKSLDLTTTILKKATSCLEVAVGEDLPLVRGNAQKLQQVMVNLLVNGAQALTSPDQAIEVRAFLGEDGVVLEVADQGPGVAAHVLKRLTDPFFTTRRDQGGTGLGLSISQRIVHDHGGRLTFFSRPGQGVTARVVLPLGEN